MEIEIAAFLQFRYVAAGEAEILQLFTCPQFRRMEFGRALVRDLAHRFDTVTIYLEVRASNTAARQLYVSEGFTHIGIRRSYYSDPAEDAIVLSLNVC